MLLPMIPLYYCEMHSGTFSSSISESSIAKRRGISRKYRKTSYFKRKVVEAQKVKQYQQKISFNEGYSLKFGHDIPNDVTQAIFGYVNEPNVEYQKIPEEEREDIEKKITKSLLSTRNRFHLCIIINIFIFILEILFSFVIISVIGAFFHFLIVGALLGLLLMLVFCYIHWEIKVSLR